MDVFLSTLPPYVHCHLANHPPTDVFNVLRDLICFAVIYSNSITSVRDAIQNFDKTSPELLNTAPVVAEQKASARPDAVLAHNKNTNTKTKTVTKENLKPKRDIPNIYPSWWGDQDQDDPELWRVPKRMVDEMTQTIDGLIVSHEPTVPVSRAQNMAMGERTPGYVAWIPANSDKPLVALASKDLPSFAKLPPRPRALSTSAHHQLTSSNPRPTNTTTATRRRSEVSVMREVMVMRGEEVDVGSEAQREKESRRERGRAFSTRSRPTSNPAGVPWTTKIKRPPVYAIASEFLQSRFLECLDGVVGEGMGGW